MQPQKGYKIFEEWGNYLFAAGGAIQDANNKVVLDSPQAREALQAYIDIYEQSAPKNSLNWSFDEATRAVSSDKAAQLVSYNWQLPNLNKSGKLADKFALAEVPGGKAILGSWSWSIPKNSASKDAAWAFIQWITSAQHEKERVIKGGAPVPTAPWRIRRCGSRASARATTRPSRRSSPTRRRLRTAPTRRR